MLARWECSDCGEVYTEHDEMYIVKYEDGERYICADCREEGDYYQCDNCGYLFEHGTLLKTVISNQGYEIQICGACEDANNVHRCMHCNRYVVDAYISLTDDFGNFICYDCENDYSVCSGCGAIVHFRNVYYDEDGDCYCADCYNEAGLNEIETNSKFCVYLDKDLIIDKIKKLTKGDDYQFLHSFYGHRLSDSELLIYRTEKHGRIEFEDILNIRRDLSVDGLCENVIYAVRIVKDGKIVYLSANCRTLLLDIFLTFKSHEVDVKKLKSVVLDSTYSYPRRIDITFGEIEDGRREFESKIREICKNVTDVSFDEIKKALQENKWRGKKLTKPFARILKAYRGTNQETAEWDITQSIKRYMDFITKSAHVKLKVVYGFPNNILNEIIKHNYEVDSCQKPENFNELAQGFIDLYVNPSLKLILLYHNDELIGRAVCREFYNPDTGEKFLAPDRLFLTKFSNCKAQIMVEIFKLLLRKGYNVIAYTRSEHESATIFDILHNSHKFEFECLPRSLKGILHPSGLQKAFSNKYDICYYRDSGSSVYISKNDGVYYLRDYVKVGNALIVKLKDKRD